MSYQNIKIEIADGVAVLTLNRPVVLDCQIGSDDKVWPMVAPGDAISQAFDEEDMAE